MKVHRPYPVTGLGIIVKDSGFHLEPLSSILLSSLPEDS